MAQTTGKVNGTGIKLEISLNGGSTFQDISGSIMSVDPGERVLQSGNVFTPDGQKAILNSGKYDPLDIAVEIVYTEITNEAFDEAETAQDNRDEDVQLRWSPAGGNSGDDQFTTDNGILTNLSLPGGDAADATPVTTSFTVQTPGYTKSTVA